MLIDCDTCAVRGAACGGCMLSALLDSPEERADLTGDERRAIETFARAGFEVEVISEPARPPLRLMPGGRRRRHVA